MVGLRPRVQLWNGGPWVFLGLNSILIYWSAAPIQCLLLPQPRCARALLFAAAATTCCRASSRFRTTSAGRTRTPARSSVRCCSAWFAFVLTASLLLWDHCAGNLIGVTCWLALAFYAHSIKFYITI